MQVLSHTHELSRFLDAGTYTSKLQKKPDSVLLVEWDSLRRLMWSKNCVIAPHAFVRTTRRVARLKKRGLFVGCAQNDIQEFWLFLIDAFHEALARPVDMQVTGNPETATDALAVQCYAMMERMYSVAYSEMLGIFYGIHMSVVTAIGTGDRLSMHPEPFAGISLSIPRGNGRQQTLSLYDCLDDYCRKEELTGANQYETDAGERVDAVRGIEFWSLPDVLMLDLKRWNPISGGKVHTHVDAPLVNLDLSRYVSGYSPAAYVYDLYAVCNHGGGNLGGHYVACVRVAAGGWYEFNDTMVRAVSPAHVISGKTYCLFYRKKK